MEFCYTIVNKNVYLNASDENEEFCDEITFEPSEKELLDALVDTIFEIHFNNADKLVNLENRLLIKNSIRDFIINNELEETLSKNYEEDLKEYFRDEALARED